MPITGSGSSAVTADRSDVLPRAGFWTLMIGSIGVVYGDIGTSPLYAYENPSTPPPVIPETSRRIWCLAFCR